MKLFERAIRTLGTAELWLAVVLLVFVIIINICEIASRYVLGSSIYWVQEVTIISAGWITFLGIGVLYKRREYIRIDFFVNQLARPIQLAIVVVFNLAGLWALFIVIRYSFVLYEFQSGMLNLVLQIPQNYYYFPVAVGCASLFMTLVFQTLEALDEFWRLRRKPRRGDLEP